MLISADKKFVMNLSVDNDITGIKINKEKNNLYSNITSELTIPSLEFLEVSKINLKGLIPEKTNIELYNN